VTDVLRVMHGAVGGVYQMSRALADRPGGRRHAAVRLRVPPGRHHPPRPPAGLRVRPGPAARRQTARLAAPGIALLIIPISILWCSKNAQDVCLFAAP
jgi:hypothetical protein